MVKTRIKWIDLARVIAILTVLYIHANDGIFIISSDSIINLTIYSRFFDYVSIFIGRIGVPFFLMITGYLLLHRSYDDKRTQKFWVKNCKHLIIITIIWSIIYAITISLITVKSRSVNLSEGGALFFSHMWYMPMIIGMYLSLPFVSSALKHFNNNTIFKATVIFSILAFVLPFITLVCDINGIAGVTIEYCLGFSGGAYGIYIILGHLINKEHFKNISSTKLWIIALVSFIICVLFQYYAYLKAYDFILWYDFPFILLGSFALFELCSRIKEVKFYGVVRVLSKYSFAVFLIHNLFRLPLLPLVVKLPYSEPIKAIILWILLIIFSYMAAAIVYRIPKVGKYVLYMK